MTDRLGAWIAALLACAALAACAPEGATPLKNTSGLLPDLAFTLTDDQGRSVTARDYRDYTVLLFFGFTSCQDVCPTTLARLAAALPVSRGHTGRARVLFVTVDPQRDTLARLHEYLQAFGPEFVGLRGTAEALRSLTKRYRVAYSVGQPDSNGHYAVTHSSGVFVFDGGGKARLLIRSDDSVPAIRAGLQRIERLTRPPKHHGAHSDLAAGPMHG